MTRLPRTSPRLAERGMLLLGLASAAVLAVAAFLPSTDPELAGKTALAQLAARTNGAVVAEWERMLRDPAPIAAASSETFELDRNDVHLFASGSRRIGEEQAPAPPDDPACAALLAEADRIEIEERDVAAALAAVDEAMTKRPSTRQVLLGGLRSIQLAMRAGDLTRVRDELRDALGWEAPGILALQLDCILAGASVLGGDEDLLDRSGAVVGRWCATAVHDDRSTIEVLDAPRAWYAVRGLEPLVARLERLRTLPFAAPMRRPIERAASYARLIALESFVPWPDKAGEHRTRFDVGRLGGERDGDWSLFPVGHDRPDDWFARFGPVIGPWRGFFVTRADLVAALVGELRRRAIVPEGVELDFDGSRAELGPPIGERTRLRSDDLGFVLRHRDPEALVRGTQRKHVLLRAALLVMSVLAATTGFLMARAQRRTRKLAELKSGFVANVSHELRTPVASILLMAENLEAGRAGDEASRARYHALIKREALRLARLVDDVLDFSRIERGKALDVRRETVAARAVVDEWCEGARAWADANGMELVPDVGTVPESVAVDREAIRRALLNLLDNARKHSGAKQVTLVARAEHGALVLAVADRGRGVPHARRAAIFEPFERGERIDDRDGAPGTGLGLAIVKEIVLAHGGTIAVLANEDGPGSVFEIRLPATSEETIA